MSYRSLQQKMFLSRNYRDSDLKAIANDPRHTGVIAMVYNTSRREILSIKRHYKHITSA